MKRGQSLQRRLLWLVLGMVTAAWLLAAVATVGGARHELDELLDGHLAQAAALLVARQDAEPGGEGVHANAPLLHHYAPRVAFQVFHAGRLAFRSANAPDGPLPGALATAGDGFSTVVHAGVPWRVFSARGAANDVQVYVGERLDARDEILAAVLRGALWPLVIALPALAGAVWWAVRQGLLPLRRLGSTLAQRRPEALEPLPMADMAAEMRPMLEALNALFGRIAALVDNERRFTADAAHELRTPIAAIRAQAQVALGEQDGELRRHALLRTLDGCDRASRIVDQLLTLARLESSAPARLAQADLGAVCRDVIAALAPAAFGKGQSLEFEGLDHCAVRGDATLLRVLVRNLCDNAARYAGPGARIVASLSAGAGGFSLAIEDSGPGLDEAGRAALGTRFRRKDGQDEAGSGLGWSICERVCRAHGFTLRAESSARLGGLRVQVAGPC